ncbi:MAG: hypothetical protein HC896_09815, partial [Bacteroidales bacterium]|nr:hypothetical protein [Bacteroidales bacterium]
AFKSPNVQFERPGPGFNTANHSFEAIFDHFEGSSERFEAIPGMVLFIINQ